MRRFVLRTVKNGAVRISGKTFRPETFHQRYDGRLDGQRFAFGLYENDENLACLWGTEAAYNVKTEEEFVALPPGPEVVDGTLPWLFWRASPRPGEEAQAPETPL